MVIEQPDIFDPDRRFAIGVDIAGALRRLDGFSQDHLLLIANLKRGFASLEGERVQLVRHARFALTRSRWALLSRDLDRVVKEGPVETISGLQNRRDIETRVLLTNGYLDLRTNRPGWLVEKLEMELVRVHDRRPSTPVVVPGQPLVVMRGHYCGGHGTTLPVNSQAIVGISDRHLVVLSGQFRWIRPLIGLRGVQLGGPGAYRTGGGFIGGGFGVAGALGGAALASVLNSATTRVRIHTLMRLVFTDADVTFALNNRTPVQIERELTRLGAALRGDAVVVPVASQPRVIPQAAPVRPTSNMIARFCGSCGTIRRPDTVFCVSCGTKLD